MAYIAPDGIIQIFGDVSLAPGQEDTLYFASTSAKDSYFDGLTKLATFSAQSYTRRERGYVRVERNIGLLYDACYMRYKNSSFENKWFYAFITRVNYINNITTEIEFEIDIMMTWMGTFSLAQCFIERQHTVSDDIGDNIADENIPCGDYKYEFVTSSGYIGSNGFWYCLASTYDPEDSGDDPAIINGAEYGGVYSGIHYYYTNQPETLDTWLENLTGNGKSDAVVGVAVVPYTFITDADAPPVERSQTFTKPYSTLDGYTPKNNKLFCYPYKSIQVTNLEGNFAEFRYEFFSGNSAQFTFIGVTGMQTEIVCEPINYKGVQENLTEKITMSDFPMCSYAIDAFMAYLAQNKSSIAANVISAGASIATGLSMVSPSAPSLIASVPPSDFRTELDREARNEARNINTAAGIVQQLGSLLDYARKPPQAGGAQGTSALLGRPTGRQKKDFYFIGKTITSNYAIMIDNYFDMYGYKINQHGVPNMNARPNWTYVKTIGCVVHGNLPADDARAIEQKFDSGVRFWKNHANIGNYNLANAPV